MSRGADSSLGAAFPTLVTEHRGATLRNPIAAQDATASANCATSVLVVWLNVPPGNDYAGGAYYDLEFTNLSGHACTLRGYPGVSAVSLNGRPTT